MMVRTLLAVILCLGFSSAAQASLWLYTITAPFGKATGSYNVGDIATLQWTMEQPPASAFIGQGGFIQINFPVPNATLNDGKQIMNVGLRAGFRPPVPGQIVYPFEYSAGGNFGPPGTDPRLSSVTESTWRFFDPATGDSWEYDWVQPGTRHALISAQPIPEASAATIWLGLLTSGLALKRKRNQPGTSSLLAGSQFNGG